MKKIAFIGTGHMASAMIRGMLSGKLSVREEDVILFNRSPEKYANFSDLHVTVASSAVEAVSLADIIVLAVKPQNYAEVLKTVASADLPLDRKVFVSVAAGISIEAIEKGLGKNVAVVRTMPNTPLQIGLGVTALCRNALVSDEDYSFVTSLFACAGETFDLPEKDMNTVICATGSSPAYVYYLIDAMIRSAEAQGLQAEHLAETVCDAVIGSAALLKKAIRDEGKSPADLIRAVCSPNGTTERAMQVFNEEKVDETIDRAMRRCTERAEEMARDFS